MTISTLTRMLATCTSPCLCAVIAQHLLRAALYLRSTYFTPSEGSISNCMLLLVIGLALLTVAVVGLVLDGLAELMVIFDYSEDFSEGLMGAEEADIEEADLEEESKAPTEDANDAIDNNTARLKAIIAILEPTISTLESRITHTRAQTTNNDALPHRNDLPAHQLAALTTANRNLTADLSTLRLLQTQLTAQTQTLTTQKQHLSTQNRALAAEKQSLAAQNTTLVAQRNTLTVQNNTLAGNIRYLHELSATNARRATDAQIKERFAWACVARLRASVDVAERRVVEMAEEIEVARLEVRVLEGRGEGVLDDGEIVVVGGSEEDEGYEELLLESEEEEDDEEDEEEDTVLIEV